MADKTYEEKKEKIKRKKRHCSYYNNGCILTELENLTLAEGKRQAREEIEGKVLKLYPKDKSKLESDDMAVLYKNEILQIVRGNK